MQTFPFVSLEKYSTGPTVLTANIDGLHLTSRRPCLCTEQCSKMSFGNLTLLLCKTCEAIFLLFFTPTLPSHHVDVNQELFK